MDGVYKHYVIDLSCNNNFVQVPTVQGDGNNVRGFEVELISNNVHYIVDPENTIVSIAGTKPDTKQILNSCEVTKEGFILVDITNQMSAVAGRGDYSITLMDRNTNSLLQSFPFYILTTKSAFNASEIVSSNEFTLLTSKIVDAENATKDAIKATEDLRNLETLVKDAEDARIDAEVKRIQAEFDRNTAEQKRQTDTATAIQDANKAIVDAKKATNDTLDAIANAQTAINDANTAASAADSIAKEVKDKLDKGLLKGDKGDKGDPGKDAVVTTVAMNQMGFNVDSDGNLILTFEDGNTDAKKFSITVDGDLIYTLS